MDEFTLSVRTARQDDGEAVARVYVDAWRDTYPGILPTELLRGMSVRVQAGRWRAAIAGGSRERVLVAEGQGHGVIGMTSLGAAQDRALGYDGEIYTLYVSPDFFGHGIGTHLLRAGFGALRAAGFTSCVIWAHARNPARFFYEAMGGRLVAERSRRMGGMNVPEAAFGWKRLTLAERKTASGGSFTRS
ncbi:MAG TPA: GNAT family N-acetyltransferase [Rhizomicrobium sp.]|nr:GNAT family N-acetyltransferase [Rhizomicrobium sp.]